MKQCLNSSMRKNKAVKQILKGSETQSFSSQRCPCSKLSKVKMGVSCPSLPWACVDEADGCCTVYGRIITCKRTRYNFRID